MVGYLQSWLRLTMDRRAVTALEYGLIAGAIAAVIAGTLVTMGGSIESTFNTVSSSL